MLRTADNGAIYWDETRIRGATEKMDFDQPLSANDIQKIENYLSEKWGLEKLADKRRDHAKKYAHNFKVLDKRSKKRDEDIEDLYDHVAEIREELMLLQQSKMSKPSHADELEDAEKYVDDYFDIQRKRKRERWARKQRIQKKLKKIERVNAEPEPNRKWPRRVFVLLVGLGLGFLAFTW